MHPRSLGLVALVLCSAPAAAAQQSAQPNLVLTMFAGAVTGNGLWTIAKQPLCVFDATFGCSPQHDTLRLGRETTASITVGASMTYFPKPAFGFQVDVAYVGLPLTDACQMLFSNADTTNQQICADIQGQSHSTGAVSVVVSGLARLAPHGGMSPYVRAGFGILSYDHSTVEMSGAFAYGTAYPVRLVIADTAPRRTSVSGVLGAGMTFALNPGYQFRLEAHDIIVNFPRPTGPADDRANPPTGSRSYHHLALTMGLDVVLEKKRGRRY